MISFMGIDPGVNGAIAVIEENSKIGPIVTYTPMPSSDIHIIEALYNAPFASDGIAMEKVTGYIPKGKNKDGGERKHGGQPGSHMFELGRNYGLCLGVLYSRIHTHTDKILLPAPVTWQKGLGLTIPKGLDYDQRKRELHSHARRLVPDTKISKQCADAVLLALYAQKVYHQSLEVKSK